jgi:hypothetical protein
MGDSGNQDHQWEALRLFSYSKLLDDVAVPIDVVPLQVIQKAPTLADHLEQTAAGMVVFLMKLKVLGEIPDLLAEDRYLHLRGTCVCRMQLVISDKTGFLFFIQTQCLPPKTKNRTVILPQA